MAEGLFQDGKRLLDAGQVAEACAKLGESYRIDPALGTLLNLAVCHERLGKTASAWSEFTDAVAIAERGGETERAQFARTELATLESIVPRFVVRVSRPVPELIVKVDGNAVGAPAWGTAIPLDPGEHTVEATAPGRKQWTASLTLSNGAPAKVVDIPELARVDAPALAPPSAVGSKLETSSDSVPDSSGSRHASARRTWGYVAASVGLIGLGAGTYWGLRTLAKQGVVDDHCDPGTCRDQTGIDAEKAAHRAATLADVSFGVGLAGVALGTYLLFTGRDAAGDARVRPQQSRSSHVHWLPALSAHSAEVDAFIAF